MRTLTFALLALTLAGPAAAEERRAPPTADEVQERVDRHLDQVDATPEQRAEVHGLVEKAVEQREVFRAEHLALRTRFKDLLWAEHVDRAGLEQVRLQVVGLFDRVTTFGLDHMVSVAEVLTPEQRVQVHDRLSK